tara:strand:+ start:2156 stop:4882 length:2727 start_codon:yes stop_codon:yes gene_type:complete
LNYIKTINIFVLFVGLLLCGTAFSQQKNLYHVPPASAVKGADLVVSASLIDIDNPIEAVLYYKTPISNSFLEIPLENKGFNWEAVIPKFAISDIGLEYVIVFRFRNDRILSYPRIDPFNNPYSIQVIDDPTKQRSKISNDKAEIIILSPDIGEIVDPNEVFIAASFFLVEDIDRSSVRLLLNKNDKTSDIIFEDDIISFAPNALSNGDYIVEILMTNKKGENLPPFSWGFTIGNKVEKSKDFVSYKGGISNRLSSEAISGSILNIAEIQGKFDMDFNWAQMNIVSRATSRETPYLQPQNRFGGKFSFGNFLKVSFGDFYPRMNEFMVDGKRVRGLELKTDFKWVKFDFMQGEISRAVQEQQFVDGGYRLNNNLSTKNIDGSTTYYIDRSGYTFKRNIVGAKISTDLFDRFKFGVHLMSVRDDTNSVNLKLTDAKFSSDSLVSGITPGDYTFTAFSGAITAAGNQLDIKPNNWSGKKPHDNLMFGFNFGTSFDDKKLDFDFDWNLSLYNRNIWGGAMSKTNLDTALDDTLDGYIGQQYDELGNLLDGDAISIDQIPFDPEALKDIFIINSNMTPLVPFDINSSPLSGLINMPSSAFRFSLKGNYTNSKILIEYRQIGPEYVTLGNPFLRNNTRQFTISDRASFLKNKLFINFGFKHLDNKILRTTINPLNTNTFFVNFNFIPGPGLPSYAVSLQSIGKNNEKTKLDSVGGSIIDLREDSNISNNMLAVTVPIQSNNISHNITLNMGNITNLDNLASRRNVGYLFPKTDSRTISLNIASEFSNVFNAINQVSQTKLDIPVVSSNTLQKTSYVWTNISSTANYRLIENRILLKGTLTLIDSKSQIRSQLVGLRGGIDYNFRSNLTASLISFVRINYIGNNNGQSYKEGFDLNSSGIIFNIDYNFNNENTPN